jgi:hypothetical protein
VIAGCSGLGSSRERGETPASGSNDAAAAQTSTPQTTDLGSLYGPLASGRIVALHPHEGVTVVDPRDHESNAAAIEAANRAIVEAEVRTGHLYLPASDPAGERFVIERQVLIGARSQAASISVDAPTTGSSASGKLGGNGAIGTEIDDGSAVFVWASDTGDTADGDSGFAARDVYFGGRFDLGQQDVSLLRMQNINNFHVVPSVRNYAGSALILDGVANGSIGGRYHPRHDDARVIDSRAGYQAADSDIHLLPETEVESNYDTAVTDVDGRDGSNHLTRLWISGHMEGATNAYVDIHYDSKVIVTEQARFGSQPNYGTDENVADGLRYQGTGWFVVGGCTMSRIRGNGIVVGGDAQWFDISPNVSFNPWTIDGDAIVVESPPQKTSTLPAARAVRGTTSYPSDTDTLEAIQTETL